MDFTDLDNNGVLSTSELSVLRHLTLNGNGQGTNCANITTMLEHAEVSNGSRGVLTSSDDVAKVLAELLACTHESFVDSITVTMGKEGYECVHADEHDHHDDEHDEHDDDNDHDDRDDHGDHDNHNDHDDHDAEKLVIRAAGANLTCSTMQSDHREEEEVTLDIASDTWLLTMGAVALVSATSLAGALTLVSSKTSMLNIEESVVLATDISAAAVGTLVGTVFFHLLPEATVMSMEGMTGAATYPGLVLILGVASAMVVGVMFHHPDDQDVEAALEDSRSSDDPMSVGGVDEKLWMVDEDKVDTKGGTKLTVADRALVANIVWGDALHNFTDGVLIAATFALCSPAIGWTVTLSVVLHELPQEFLDFIILIRAGLSVRDALFLNFLSGCTCILGAIIVLASGSSISVNLQGYLIMYGTGVLLYVALVELAPRILMAHHSSSSRKYARLALMALGVGLILALSKMHPEGCGHDHHGH
jgi:zinc transporter ZupT